MMFREGVKLPLLFPGFRRRLKKCSFCLLSLLFGMEVPAQSGEGRLRNGGWTLEECIRYAREHSLVLEMAREERQAVLADLQKAKADFFPDLHFSFSHRLDWGRSVDLQNLEIIRNRLSQHSSLGLQSSLTLLEGGARIFRLRSGRIAEKASVLELEKLQNDLSVQVTAAFLEVLLAEELLKGAVGRAESTLLQRRKAELHFREGRITRGAVLEMKAEEAAAAADRTAAGFDLANATLRLRQLMNLREEEPLVAVPDSGLFRWEEYPVRDYEALCLSLRELPEIRLMEAELERRSLALKTARGSRWPRISLMAGYGTFYSSTTDRRVAGNTDFFRQLTQNLNPSVGIGMQVSLFNRLEVRRSVRKAETEMKKAGLELSILRQKLLHELQRTVQETGRFFHGMQAAKAKLDACRERFRLIGERWDGGSVDTTGYRLALSDVQTAESAYLNAKYRFLFQLKRIRFYRK